MVVQYIPRAKTTGQRFGEAFAGAAESLAENIPKHLKERDTKRKMSEFADMLDENFDETPALKFISELYRSDLPPEDISKMATQLIGKDPFKTSEMFRSEKHAKGKKSFVEKTPKMVKDLNPELWALADPDERQGLFKFSGTAFDRAEGDPVEAQRLLAEELKRLSTGEEEEVEGEEEKEEIAPSPPEKEASSWRKGYDSSIAARIAAIKSGESYSDFEKRTALPEDATILQRALYTLGKFKADSPFYFAGGKAGALGGAALGTAVSSPTLIGVPAGALTGAIAGTGTGAFALTAMIETAVQEYHQYLERDGKGSLGDFINSVGHVLKEGVDAGLEGFIFGTLTAVMPLLKLNPKMRRLFDATGIKGKVAETITTAAIETTGILGSRIASGQKVSAEDAEDLFVNVLGLGVFGRLAPKLKKHVARIIEKSGIEPQDFAQNVAADLQAKGRDPNNPSDFTKSVKDVSKEYSKAKEIYKETPKAAVGEEQLEAARGEEKALAERITKEPVEKILALEKPTKAEQKLMEKVSDIEKENVRLKENLEKLEGLKKPSRAEQGALELTRNELQKTESALKGARQELKDFQAEREKIVKARRKPGPTSEEI